MLNVRFRHGTVRESARVVHAAEWTADGSLASLCGLTFNPELMEAAAGMPCMRCIRIAAERSQSDRVTDTHPSIAIDGER